MIIRIKSYVNSFNIKKFDFFDIFCFTSSI
nr:MAG TPA: hypothetical protein [Caudoviricetes sp.]